MQNAEQTYISATKDFSALIEALIDTVTPFALSAVGALFVLLAGLWVAGRIRAVVRKMLSRSGRVDATLSGFLSSLVYYGLVALVAITTLGVFGVPTTSFAAVIGAAGLAIGLALQGTLSHVASGVMLLAFRPFKIDDYVETAGHEGTVKEVSLFTTVLATVDNKKVIIPNGEVWAGSIVNYSAFDERRVDLVFGVSYDDDLNAAQRVISDAVAAETRILRDPEPTIEVDTLNDSSVDIICRVWVARSDYFPVKWALTKDVKERLDAAGVSIPFPTRTIVSAAPASEQA
ncbi:MAG: mechanosensitive ion channel domain-containing protein [Pseudomonadota bacterium]